MFSLCTAWAGLGGKGGADLKTTNYRTVKWKSNAASGNKIPKNWKLEKNYTNVLRKSVKKIVVSFNEEYIFMWNSKCEKFYIE